MLKTEIKLSRSIKKSVTSFYNYIFGLALAVAMVAVVFSPSYASAEDASYDWAYAIGGVGYDRGTSMVTDSAGNIYTTGYFAGTVDFDPSPSVNSLTASYGNGAFVLKLDSAGNFVWVKGFGLTGGTNATSIALDPAGNIYTTGNFSSTTDFDPGPGVVNLSSLGYPDVFVSKLDSSGNFVWAKSFGSSGYDYGRSLAVDSAGSVYLTSTFSGTIDFDPGPGVVNLSSAGYSDSFVSKLDSSGNFVWAKSIGGTNYDYGYDVTTDNSGNVYAVGSYQGTIDADPGAGVVNFTSVSGSVDFFIVKMDSSGNYIWAKSIGGISNDDAKAITSDSAGNIFLTGSHGGADFDPGPGVATLTTVGAKDIFVLKLNSSGNYVWAKSFGGGSNADEGQDIAVDSVGSVYTTGYYYDNVDFDPGPGVANMTSGSNTGSFVQKLDASGNYVWAKSFFGPSIEEGYGIAVDSSSNVFATGSFYNTVDFDPGAGVANLTASGQADLYVVKLLAPIPPTVADLATTDIDKTGAKLNGDLISLGSSPVTTRGFEYGLSNSYGSLISETGVGFSAGNFFGELSGLTCGTQYFFRTFATSVVATSYGSGSSFLTAGCIVQGSKSLKSKLPANNTQLPQPVQPIVPVALVGTNVKGPDGTVYLITQGNYRSPYTSAGAFLSYKFNTWSGVINANSADLALPVSSSFIPPRNGSLINDKGTVYLITGGLRAGFANESAFKGLGYTYDFVRKGDTSFMKTLPPIDSASQKHPDGTIIKYKGTLYIMRNGARQGFPSMTVFNSWGYWIDEAVLANSYDLTTQVTGVVQARTPDQLSL